MSPYLPEPFSRIWHCWLSVLKEYFFCFVHTNSLGFSLTIMAANLYASFSIALYMVLFLYNCTESVFYTFALYFLWHCELDISIWRSLRHWNLNIPQTELITSLLLNSVLVLLSLSLWMAHPSSSFPVYKLRVSFHHSSHTEESHQFYYSAFMIKLIHSFVKKSLPKR